MHPPRLLERRPAQLVGADRLVACVDGSERRYVNLDYAASTPPLQAVWDAVSEFIPWYSSVHRGSGIKSQISTSLFEWARERVLEFAGADADGVAIFVRNTTEAINLLASLLPVGTRVLSSAAEHHANMLPWRGHEVELLPFTRSSDELVDACRAALEEARGGIRLVAVTGASNVTGEIWPVAELAEAAHAHGAELFVDAAQLAPHRRLAMAELGVDYLAFSGHKLYAPFGAGALVARSRRLLEAEPLLRGGGAVRLVTLDDVVWADAPERFEAGSPNVVGAVALGSACDELMRIGIDDVAERERALTDRLHAGLAEIPGVRTLRLWDDADDRVGVTAFEVEGYRHALVAAMLSAEHAIGVRHGRFCAHPLVARLLGVPEAEVARIRAEVAAGRRVRKPGCVRASIGIGTAEDDVDALLEALRRLVDSGPGWRYVHDPERDEYRPDPDPRRLPELGIGARARQSAERAQAWG